MSDNITLTAAMRGNLSQLRSTATLMDRTQSRIASGKKVNSALDDPSAFFKAKGLTDSAGDLAVLKDNMGQSISTIQAADKAITSITSLVEQAKSLANSAKSSSVAADRASLATQFNDIRAQIDTLAADATYSGSNLVAGRGIITGGTFVDTTAATETALAGVATGGLSITGTSTDVGSYAFTVQQKASDLSTSVTLTGSVAKDAEVFINGVSVGTITGSTTASTDATAIAALSAEISASGAVLTVTDGNVMEVRDSGTAGFIAGSGLTAGLQNDITGAQVKDLTSDLGIYGAEVYAHISGYTDNVDLNTTFTVSGTGSSQILTVKDGTGQSATINTSVFSAAGTDTLSVGDLTINFVTSTATENTNAAPVVAAGPAAVAQVGTLTWAASTAVKQVDTITLVGASTNATDTYTATVDGTTYTYTATGGTESITTIASGLAALIDPHSAVVATAALGVITLTATTAGAGFTTTGVAEVGTSTSLTLVNDGTGASVVNVTGYESGDEISVVINGNTYAYALTADKANATLAATAFVSAMKATIEAAENVTIADAGTPNGKLTVTSVTAGDAFTLAATQTVAATDKENSGTMVTIPTTANTAQTATITVAGNIDDGDVFSTTINGTTISYTAKTADTTATLVAVGLVAAINANTTLVNGSSGVIATATDDGAGVITLTENAKGVVLTITAAGTDAAISLGNESNLTSTQATLKSLTTGTATGDARVKVVSGSTTVTANIDTTSTVAVTISDAAFGSTFSLKADDATMVAGETSTVVVTNPTGKGANDASVVFNAAGTSTINVQAVDITSSGLSVSAALNTWLADSDVDTAIAALDTAKTALRANSKAMATSLGVIQTRENFTANFIDNLQSGADKLTLADSTEEATNMLMLQTRQQLGIQSLSMASQSSQSILVLFR